jgi:hypothetical protein
MAIDKGDLCAKSRLIEINNILVKNKLQSVTEMNNRSQTDDMYCLICKESNDKLVNLNCELNGQHYDHCVCCECAAKWYKNNKCTCIICQKDIDADNIFLAVKMD